MSKILPPLVMNEKNHRGFHAKLERVGLFLGFKEWVFALFLLAGIFKPNPAYGRSTVDLTLLTAVITSLCTAWCFFRLSRRPVGPTLLVLCLFLLFVPSLLWTDWTSYAIEKASRFFTLTLLASVAPLYLIRTREELRRFLSGFIFLCTVVATTALIVMLSQGGELERLMVLDATTITTGRSIGTVALVVALLWFEGHTNRFLAGVALIILPTLMVATGSKGPLVSLPLALIATLLLLRKKVRPYLRQLIPVSLLGAAVFWFTLPVIPWTSLFRVGAFVTGQATGSETDRTSIWDDSLRGIAANPQGLGLGGFASKFGVGRGEIREFSHDIVLEVFLEGGWLTGSYFVFLFLLGLGGVYSAARKSTNTLIEEMLMAQLLFYFLNDMVSGELNDSKVLLAFMALAIGAKGMLPNRRASPSAMMRDVGLATP